MTETKEGKEIICLYDKDKVYMYFGHPVNFYNTEKEKELIAVIQREFPQYVIENPNQQRHSKGYERYKKETGSGMKYYYTEVLPFMAAGMFQVFEDGMFGAGVFGEAEFLHKSEKPIFEINLAEKIQIMMPDVLRKLSVEETRKRVYRR